MPSAGLALPWLKNRAHAITKKKYPSLFATDNDHLEFGPDTGNSRPADNTRRQQ